MRAAIRGMGRDGKNPVTTKDSYGAQPCAFKQRDIARAVRGAEAAGVEIGRVDIDPLTGKISIVPTVASKNYSELDSWLKGHPENAPANKGINCFRKRLANGREVVYWYAWKSGPSLGAKLARQNSLRVITRLLHGRLRHRPEFCCRFYKAIRLAKISDDRGKTRRSYLALIKRIETKFGSFSLSGMTRRARSVHGVARQLAEESVDGRRIMLGVSWRSFSRGHWTAAL